MMSMETPLLALACCGAPLLLLGGGGLLLVLVKLGVIGKYWMKGEEPVQNDGNYTLNDSVEVADGNAEPPADDGADWSDDGSTD